MDPSFQDLLKRLDHISDQFRELKEGVGKAIRIADEDPEMALTRARKVLELVVREVYERRCNEPPGTRPLENLLQRLFKEGHFPSRLDAYATTVRKLGNVGTHTFGEKITAHDVYQSLTQLMPILEWYFEVERPETLSQKPEQRQPTSAALVRSVVPPVANLAVVPKGLRSFDAQDARFFLELLPGPRDEHDLPESIRFWKHRIEASDELMFTVGVIYGPSGCGKSSLVKAGLLPRLAARILPVYIESTGADTETRLLKGLRKRCPGVPGDLDLASTIAALRQGQGLSKGQKVFVVLDQFEQWLHAAPRGENPELALALRQCDGERVQAVVMVRDDFWLAVSRFMGDLHIELIQGQNLALVDLFDLIHTRTVLLAFGRAFGRLHNELTEDQEAFLDQAVRGLSQEGRVICVRLALFAEMMKGKAWTPTILKEVGGTEGVGVTFLEETFSAANAPPEHRYHQKAARAVLKTLLPESGTDLKGHMRSHAELLEASGYANRPKEFNDLIRILDSEIRLLTPTDPDGMTSDEGRGTREEQLPAGEKYYQLTHDYLVHSLRDWLTRKQKETRRGRAELLLAERAVVWNIRPENRQLPSLSQWCRIRWLTTRKNWTPTQRKLMSKAGQYYAVRSVFLATCLVLLGLVGWEGYGRLKAQTLRDRLLESTTAEVPGIVKDMAPYRRMVDPLLKEAYTQAQEKNDSRKQLHASLALLPVDSGQVDYLYGRLLQGDPEEVVVIRGALWNYRKDLTERLWALLENPKNDQEQRFRAACTLSVFAPEDARWEKVSGDVGAMLVIQKPFVLAQWTAALKSVGRWLIPPLADFLVDEKRSLSERSLIASIYGTFAAGTPEAYSRLEKQLTEESEPTASIETKIALTKRQVSICTALLVMGRSGSVWPLFKHRLDPTLRSLLIEQLGPGGVDPKVLISRLNEEEEVSARRAILLSLGEFGVDRLGLAERRNLLPRLLQLYRDDPDPGLHGAAEWLVRLWQGTDEVKEIDNGLATGKLAGQRQWYLNKQGQTMILVPKPGEFWMGEGAERHRQLIDRSFAMASKEVTVDQFLRFRSNHEYFKEYAPTGDCPVNKVSWYEAAAYCNWLNEQEGIPKKQWCYEPLQEGKNDMGMKMAPNYLKRPAYRLPTEAEWEYACRAGSDTAFSFGEAEDLLGKYAWIDINSLGKSHPVGSLKPNDLGLFDMHGNNWEWCQDIYEEYRKGDEEKTREDTEDIREINSGIRRVLRGGAFNYRRAFVRSANRSYDLPTLRTEYNGFRVVRTLAP